MTTPTCTRYPTTGTTSAEPGGTPPNNVLRFQTGIPPSVFFERFGLNSADITFTRSVEQAVTTVTGRFNSATGTLQPSFTVVSNAQGISASTTSPGVNVSQSGPGCGPGALSCTFLVTYTDAMTQNTLTYTLTFSGAAMPGGALTSVTGFLLACVQQTPPGPCEDIVITDPNPNVNPSITGTIFLSEDCQMICQVDYRVVENFDGCCDGLTRTETNYTVYCVNLQDVMKGRGCTVRQRFDSLVARGFALDWATFLQYSILRLILSSILRDFPACAKKEKKHEKRSSDYAKQVKQKKQHPYEKRKKGDCCTDFSFSKTEEDEDEEECCSGLNVDLLRKEYAEEFKKALRKQIPKYYDIFFAPGSDFLGLDRFFRC